MNHSDETVVNCFALFTREELLEQRCRLLENELVVMGEESKASREKIATLVLMWTGIRNDLRQAEEELRQTRHQLHMTTTGRLLTLSPLLSS